MVMSESRRQEALQDAIFVQLLYVNARAQGLVLGLMAGFGIFAATNWLLLKGGEVVGPHLALLGHFLLGYRVSFVGSLIGFVYGFALGYAIGYIAAWLYNSIVRLRNRSS
jgi:hypothetical protein